MRRPRALCELQLGRAREVVEERCQVVDVPGSGRLLAALLELGLRQPARDEVIAEH